MTTVTDILKAQIEKLKVLTTEVEALEDTLNKHVKEVAMKYVEAVMKKYELCKHGHPSFPSGITDIDDWHLELGNVYVEWQSFRAYGGNDSGDFYFPVEFLYDEAALIKFEQDCIERGKINKQNEDELIRKHKEIEIARLQKELDNLKK